MMRAGFLLVLMMAMSWFVFFSTYSHAQTPCYADCTVRMNRPFSVWANSNGVDAAGYKLTMNGVVKATLPVSSLQNGAIRFQLPGIARGTYATQIVAYNATGSESANNVSLTIRATPSGK